VRQLWRGRPAGARARPAGPPTARHPGQQPARYAAFAVSRAGSPCGGWAVDPPRAWSTGHRHQSSGAGSAPHGARVTYVVVPPGPAIFVTAP